MITAEQSSLEETLENLPCSLEVVTFKLDVEE